MPLDARKSAHAIAVTNRSYTGRQRTVVFVYLISGVYSYVATTVIMRAQDAYDPDVFDVSGSAMRQSVDTLMMAPLGTNFVGVVYIADTATATSAVVASANKYEVIEELPVGIVPGGTHIRAYLRRLR